MNTSRPPLPVLFTVAEVAALLKVSPKTVRRWILLSQIKIHRIGRQIRISEPDLVSFIGERRAP